MQMLQAREQQNASWAARAVQWPDHLQLQRQVPLEEPSMILAWQGVLGLQSAAESALFGGLAQGRCAPIPQRRQAGPHAGRQAHAGCLHLLETVQCLCPLTLGLEVLDQRKVCLLAHLGGGWQVGGEWGEGSTSITN